MKDLVLVLDLLHSAIVPELLVLVSWPANRVLELHRNCGHDWGWQLRSAPWIELGWMWTTQLYGFV